MTWNNFFKTLVGLTLAFSACQTDKKETGPPMLTAITKDGKALLSDGQSIAIPHYDDPEWMIFYLVRHCEKAQDGSSNPDLSEQGKARAERLGKIMDDAVLHRIGTSNLKRTLKTGHAVAQTTASPPFDNFPPEAGLDWLSDVMQGGAGQKILYVGHTNTLPNFLNTLIGQVKYTDLPESEYGKFFVVATKGAGQSEVLEFNYK